MPEPDAHLYLSLIPEALIASQLPPEEFGRYMAVGEKFLSRGEALFFEVEPGLLPDAFPMGLVGERCRTHPDGSPKRSVYLGTYRALERVPIEALGALYLTTDDGRVLELERGEFTGSGGRELHLYQEFCPATPRVASRLSPREFGAAVTGVAQPISFPKLVFADLALGGLADDPLGGAVGDLPYREIDHLRSCLRDLLEGGAKASKNVSRRLVGRVHYRTVRSGFFVAGGGGGFAFYPMPTKAELEGEHHRWWSSAQTVSI